MAIPYPYAPTGLSPLLTPPSCAGPVNAHHQAMINQVLLSMGMDNLSKEEACKLLELRVHVLASTEELRHLMRNFVNIAEEYLIEDS